MGYIKHDSIIVTAWDEKYIKPIHKKAKALLPGLTSALVHGLINGQISFFIAPDGSKEFWNTSDECDEKRQQLVNYIEAKNTFVDYIAIRFGGDDDHVNFTVGKYRED